jgi:hypothetical protein
MLDQCGLWIADAMERQLARKPPPNPPFRRNSTFADEGLPDEYERLLAMMAGPRSRGKAALTRRPSWMQSCTAGARFDSDVRSAEHIDPEEIENLRERAG